MPAVVPHQHPTQRAASTDVVECVDRAATRRHAYDCTTASVIRRIAGAADCNCGRRGPVVPEVIACCTTATVCVDVAVDHHGGCFEDRESASTAASGVSTASTAAQLDLTSYCGGQQ